MTVHLMTVGDSARRSLTEPPPGKAPPPSLVRYGHGNAVLCDDTHLGVEHGDAGSVAELLTRLTAGDQPTREAAEGLYRLAQVGSWEARASAEITSLQARTDQTSVSTDDMVVLLSSDTASGLLAAWWNAAHMLRGDFSRLTYLDTPNRVLPMPPRDGRVVITRIPGLNMRIPAGRGPAMRVLGDVARQVLACLDDGERVDLHLSGGYKATMLYLVGIAEAMRSVKLPTGRFAEISAFVVHEDSIDKPGDTNRLIELPLRRIDPASLRDELAAAAAGRQPAGNQLEGYAYNVHSTPAGTVELTPFGEGFRTLLGPTPGGLG